MRAGQPTEIVFASYRAGASTTHAFGGHVLGAAGLLSTLSCCYERSAQRPHACAYRMKDPSWYGASQPIFANTDSQNRRLSRLSHSKRPETRRSAVASRTPMETPYRVIQAIVLTAEACGALQELRRWAHGAPSSQASQSRSPTLTENIEPQPRKRTRWAHQSKNLVRCGASSARFRGLRASQTAAQAPETADQRPKS